MRGKICNIAFLLLLFLFVSSYALNTDTPQKKKEEQQTLEHEVVVTLKLVRVHVEDKKGNPVMDLYKHDFELYDNGKSVTITDFEKHLLSLSPSESLVSKKKDAPPSLKSNRKFFLFFDFAFNHPRGILDAKKAALHFLDTNLRPTDEVGVLSYSTAKNLILHKNLTTEHQKIREVVEGFEIKDSLGRAENVERKFFENTLKVKTLEEILRKIEEGDRSIILPYGETKEAIERKLSEAKAKNRVLESERFSTQHEVLTFTRTIKDLAAALRHIPGHKHILFFSSGIPGTLFDGIPADFLSTSDSHLRDKYHEMIKELSASSSSVYTLHAEDKPNDPDRYKYTEFFDPYNKGLVEAHNKTLLGISSLQNLAEATGGKYFGNIKSYEAIMKDIQNATSFYYVLGYYVDEKWDGKYHKIKVNVKRKGCEVHVQEGYFNPNPFHKYSKIEKKLHFLELALEERSQAQPPFHFPVKALPWIREGESGLAMIAYIPEDKIQKISGEKVEFVNLIFDDQNKVVDMKKSMADVSILPQKQSCYCSLSSLPPGKYTCRIVIRNLETGNSCVASSPLTIPKIPEQGIYLNPLLLLTKEKEHFFIKGAAAEKKGGKPSDLQDLYPFDSSQYIPVVEYMASGTKEFIVVLHCSVFNISTPLITPFYTHLIHESTGTIIQASPSLLHVRKEKNAHIFHIGLKTDALPPGKYTLKLSVKEKTTQSESHTTTTFEVR